MVEIFTSPDSPFFKSAIALEVGPLTPEEFTGFLKAKFAKGKRQIHDETLVLRLRITPLVDGQCNDDLYRLGNPSPYFLALGGEVEDHIVTLGPTAISLLSVSTESEVSRLPFLGTAILLGVTMLILAYFYRRRQEA